MGTLDPLVAQYWYDQVIEGLPVWRQVPSIAVMLVWTGPLIAAGWWAARRRGWISGERRLDWALLALFGLGGWVYSLAVMREGLIAQMLAIPFAAVLLADLMPRARAIKSAVPRIAATLAVLALALPTAASALLKPVDKLAIAATVPTEALAQVEDGAKCDYGRLAELPKGVVLTTVNPGPTILVADLPFDRRRRLSPQSGAHAGDDPGLHERILARPSRSSAALAPATSSPVRPRETWRRFGN